MQTKNIQTIYIAIDDSGQLSFKEDIATFGGLIFLNRQELQLFLLKYENLINKIKCKYCKNKQCPELKHFNLKKKDLKLILNFLKSYHLLSCVIKNNEIYTSILNDPKAKGRYLDYAIKMMVKNALKDMIKTNLINPNQDIKIIIYIDESTYKSNGYYNLDKSIYNELKLGMSNIKNNTQFKNIINGNLTLEIHHEESKNNFLIQAADIVAGTIRNNTIKNESLAFVNYQTYLP